MIYLDTCAVLKLAHREAESAALRAWLLSQPADEYLVSSALTEVEAARALARTDPPALAALPGLLAAIGFFEIDQIVRRRAAAYQDPHLRSLDAIRLATAEELRGELAAFVTYDKRLLTAAQGLGLPVAAPA
ncbi:type II toxin-antitoxin system VapC family toxin [Streptomyces sp. B1866]|uniref:type II toxin-antitoxin system VapC family toxin n=1 Tax=Streptomyces sp. B1866 TaxID=3075431 RepID=UPI00288F4801|nr:type II toxin-antitoxin system VapC family toxin [Streptomyces sp. B1866]MDT3399810.1 type II toxin-antitoxin system VapC family toxin [Streptomyces sp. B1866]